MVILSPVSPAVRGLVVGLAVLAVASCGGLSRTEFIEQADTVCTEANNQLRAIGPLPDIDIRYASRAQMPAAAAYMDRVLPVFHRESSRLHQLGDPSDDEGEERDVLMFFDKLIGRLEEARRAAHAGDAGTFTPTLLQGLGDGVQAQDVAPRFGFKVCGQLPPLRN